MMWPDTLSCKCHFLSLSYHCWGPPRVFGDRRHSLKMWWQTIFKMPTSDRSHQENRNNLRQQQTAFSINKPTYNFSFCSKATVTFNMMKQETQQLKNEQQAIQDIPLEGPTVGVLLCIASTLNLHLGLHQCYLIRGTHIWMRLTLV